MKFVILLVVSFSTTFVFASAKCPSDSTMIKSCSSTPMAGDEILAAEMLDSIAICENNGKTLMVVEKNGESDSDIAAVTRRAGSTSYSILTNSDVEFQLSVVTGTREPAKKASFSVTLKAVDMTAKSTYTCN